MSFERLYMTVSDILSELASLLLQPVPLVSLEVCLTPRFRANR